MTSVTRKHKQDKVKIVTFDWGLDFSRSAQGAGGVGGLLTTRTSEFASSRYTTNSRRIGQHFPSYDANGNIIAWTSEGGEHRTTRDFDAFGNIVTNQGERWNESTPFGFSTKYEDVETGLLYYGYRYYDPVTGRWPSRDPIEERGGINLYGMLHNDVLNKVDLLGLDAVVVSGGINKNLKTDPDHDKNWKNFITAAKLYIQKLKKKIGPGEEIEWHVEENSYRVRESSEDNLMEMRYESYYINEIKSTAKSLGVKLVFYNGEKELINNVNGGGRQGNDKISDFSFFGHGNSSGWFTEGMSAGQGPLLTHDDIKLFMAGSFKVGCKCTSYACNTATKDDSGNSFADSWKAALGLDMWAIRGRSDYAPTAVSKKKLAVWHVKEIFTDAGEKPREKMPEPGFQNDGENPSEWVDPTKP